jgi:hypothetical protein
MQHLQHLQHLQQYHQQQHQHQQQHPQHLAPATPADSSAATGNVSASTTPAANQPTAPAPTNENLINRIRELSVDAGIIEFSTQKSLQKKIEEIQNIKTEVQTLLNKINRNKKIVNRDSDFIDFILKEIQTRINRLETRMTFGSATPTPSAASASQDVKTRNNIDIRAVSNKISRRRSGSLGSAPAGTPQQTSTEFGIAGNLTLPETTQSVQPTQQGGSKNKLKNKLKVIKKSNKNNRKNK